MTVGRFLALPALLACLTLLGCSDGTPRVKRVYPDFSSLRGDEDVRIEGSGFRTDLGYTVYFGTQRAPSVMVENEGLLVATTPGVESPREVDVRIVADNGKTFLLKKAFRYIDGSIDQRLFFGGGAEAKKAKARVHQ
jgi:hypothetical protein